VKGGKTWRLCPETGECSEYPFETNKGYTTLTVDIPPSGSILLVVSQKKAKSNRPQSATIRASQLLNPLTGILVNAVEDNVLTLDFCDLSIEGKLYPDIHTVKASGMVFREYGFPGNPWNSAIQYKDEWLRHEFPKKSGYEAVYRFTIADDTDVSTVKLVTECGATTVKINGQTIQPQSGQWWLDKSFKVFPVGSLIRNGTNEITLSVSPMHILAEVEPVYLLGRFGLESAAKGWTITTPQPLQTGSWRKQGMPFYARSVDYTADYAIETKASYRVRLPEWNGTVAEVIVNGQSAGVIYAPPFVLDITERIKTGKNRITVRVYGSNKNLLGPFHGSLPEGLTSPGQWMGVERGMPEGQAYQQLDYGLLDDFIVENCR
jgi:hypothetical protein